MAIEKKFMPSSSPPPPPLPPVDELFDELSGKNCLGRLKNISCKGMLQKKQFLQAIGRGGWTGGSRDTQSFYTCFQSVFIRDLTSVVERVPAIKIIKYGCFRHTTMPSGRIC